MQHFFVAGINYKKSDIATRGSFSLSRDQYEKLLQKAKDLNYKDLFVLSTCNRTEIYGIVSDASYLIDLLCEFSDGSIETFNQKGYIKNGCFAAEHLFNVSAGLDSQILGDYEIVGQLKVAVKIAKSYGLISAFLERLTNCSYKASKTIKNATSLSGGTISVAFAAIQYLKQLQLNFSSKKFLLLGAGKIGKNTCKNLVDYLGVKNITIINRTNSKAEQIARELNLQYASFEDYKKNLQEANVIIVATNAENVILSKENFLQDDEKILIDLSVPNNIDRNVKEIIGISLVNVDDLARINDETLEMRKRDIPKAQSIINEQAKEFYEWYQQRKQAPLIRTAKKRMVEYNNHVSLQNPHICQNSEKNVQKLIKTMAVKMKEEHRPGCIYLETMNDFMSLYKS